MKGDIMMRNKEYFLSNADRKEIKSAYASFAGIKLFLTTLMKELDPSNPAAIKLLEMTPQWGALYELPYKLVLLKFFHLCSSTDLIKSIATSSAPLAKSAEVAEKLLSEDADGEIRAINNSLNEKEKALSTAFTFVLLGNFKATQMFGVFLSTLVSMAKQNDKALFRAVQVDATVVSAPGVAKRIKTAEALSDTNFLKELSSSVSKSKNRRHVDLDDMRHMLVVVDERFGISNLTDDDLVAVFNDDLELLTNEKGDSLASIKWHIRKWRACQEGNF
jgi:hypothetical protein